MRPLFSAVLVVLLGCGGSAPPAVDERSQLVDPEVPTVRARLSRRPMAFRVVPQESQGSFMVRRTLHDEKGSYVPLQLRDGFVDVEAAYDMKGPTLEVSRFEAALRDVWLTPAQLPPDGLLLTQVRYELLDLSLLRAQWVEGNQVVWATGELNVAVHTSLRLSTGEDSPLEVGRLEALPVQLTVQKTAGGVLVLALTTGRPGFVWSWADLFELTNLNLTVEAYEAEAMEVAPPGMVLR